MAFQDVGLDILGFGSRLITRAWDLQRSYAFQLVMPSNIGGNLGIDVSTFCMACQLGNYDMSELGKMQYGPQQRFYAGMQSISKVTLAFINPTDASVFNYFLEWSYLCIDREGYYHPKADYAKDIYVVTYDQSGLETNKFRLRGCFPTNKPKVDVSYTSEDVQWVRMDLSVDQVEVGSIAAEIFGMARVAKRATPRPL